MQQRVRVNEQISSLMHSCLVQSWLSERWWWMHSLHYDSHLSTSHSMNSLMCIDVHMLCRLSDRGGHSIHTSLFLNLQMMTIHTILLFSITRWIYNMHQICHPTPITTTVQSFHRRRITRSNKLTSFTVFSE